MVEDKYVLNGLTLRHNSKSLYRPFSKKINKSNVSILEINLVGRIKGY